MKQLTAEQLQALRAVPLGDAPNKIRLALALVSATQTELVQQTGFAQPYVSDVVRGRFQDISVDRARRFAEALGASIEDLFPRRDREVAA